MSERGSPGSVRIDVGLTEDDVACIAGVVAQLSIAVNDTKVVKVDAERASRLAQAEYLVGRWQRVVQARRDLRKVEAEARGER